MQSNVKVSFCLPTSHDFGFTRAICIVEEDYRTRRQTFSKQWQQPVTAAVDMTGRSVTNHQRKLWLQGGQKRIVPGKPIVFFERDELDLNVGDPATVQGRIHPITPLSHVFERVSLNATFAGQQTEEETC